MPVPRTGALSQIANQVSNEWQARQMLSELSGGGGGGFAQAALSDLASGPSQAAIRTGPYRNALGQVDPKLFQARNMLSDLAAPPVPGTSLALRQGYIPPFQYPTQGPGIPSPAGPMTALNSGMTPMGAIGPGNTGPLALGPGSPISAVDDLAAQAQTLSGSAAEAASAGGRFARLRGLLPSLAVEGGAAGGLARLGGLGGLATRAGLYGTAATVAQPVVEAVAPGNNSNIEQGLQGATYGAALGAGIGAPFFGVGAGVGALAGGAIGGALGVISNTFMHGDDVKGDTSTAIQNALGQSNLPPEAQQEILGTYNVLMALAQGDEKEEAAARQQVGQLIMQRMAASEDARTSTESMLATQALAGQFFQPFTQQMMQASNLRSGLTEQMAGDLPPAYRQLARLSAINSQDSTARLASAFSTQAQLIPAIHTLEGLNAQPAAVPGADFASLVAQAQQ